MVYVESSDGMNSDDSEERKLFMIGMLDKWEGNMKQTFVSAAINTVYK